MVSAVPRCQRSDRACFDPPVEVVMMVTFVEKLTLTVGVPCWSATSAVAAAASNMPRGGRRVDADRLIKAAGRHDRLFPVTPDSQTPQSIRSARPAALSVR